MILQKIPAMLGNILKVAYGITDDASGEEIALKVCACLCRPFLWVAWKALATISSKSPYLSKEKQINVVQNSLILENLS